MITVTVLVSRARHSDDSPLRNKFSYFFYRSSVIRWLPSPRASCLVWAARSSSKKTWKLMNHQLKTSFFFFLASSSWTADCFVTTTACISRVRIRLNKIPLNGMPEGSTTASQWLIYTWQLPWLWLGLRPAQQWQMCLLRWKIAFRMVIWVDQLSEQPPDMANIGAFSKVRTLFMSHCCVTAFRWNFGFIPTVFVNHQFPFIVAGKASFFALFPSVYLAALNFASCSWKTMFRAVF